MMLRHEVNKKSSADVSKELPIRICPTNIATESALLFYDISYAFDYERMQYQ